MEANIKAGDTFSRGRVIYVDRYKELRWSRHKYRVCYPLKYWVVCDCGNIGVLYKRELLKAKACQSCNRVINSYAFTRKILVTKRKRKKQEKILCTMCKNPSKSLTCKKCVLSLTNKNA